MMKKVIFTAMALLIVFTISEARQINGSNSTASGAGKDIKTGRAALKNLEGAEVSSMARGSFAADFGNVPDVKWKRNGPFDEAMFTKDGKQMTAYYDYEGNLVGATRLAAFSELPARGQKEINRRYREYTVGPVIWFEDNETNTTDMVLYGIQFDDADTWLVELTKGDSRIVVQVDKAGETSYFQKL